ncbi:MAG: Glycerophosphoryl diester phosphodiesterase [Conexibacter sp.]|nr:Glycerophosphoryl diester phosphodiesterase [Conexibacter sp.]
MAPQRSAAGDDHPGVPTSLQVLAHRGLLDGPDPARENLLTALSAAAAAGFGSELDVREDAGALVLSHDPAPWAPDRDATAFLSDPPGDDLLHAFNVKDPGAVLPAVDVLAAAGALHRVFFFDVELACPDLEEAAALAAAVAARGGAVARRLSDREPALAAILSDPQVEHVWLDEWDGPWVDAPLVARLRDAGKSTWYVSPELHRPQPVASLRPRWEQLRAWGAHGICTDHPMALVAALGAPA